MFHHRRIFFIFTLLLCCGGVFVMAQVPEAVPEDTKLSLIQHIERWYADNMTYPVIVLLMALESSFLGIIPSELIVSAAAYISLDPSVSLSFWGVVVAATIGSLLGGLINYGLAIFLGRKALYTLADTRLGHFCMLSGEKMLEAEKWFVKYSKISVCIGRLVPGVRQLISVPAGLSRMRLPAFMLYTAVGSSLWNTVLATIGYLLHGQEDLIQKYTFEISYLTGGGVVAVVIFFIIKQKLKKKKTEANQRVFGLIGAPLTHSMSKKYFFEKFEQEKINARFELFEIQNIEELPALLQREPKLEGLNVTFPLKEKILPFLDEIDACAAQIGAVNCVKITRDKFQQPYLKGYNTDYIGFEKAIQPYVEKDTRALLLGTGGAAKAILFALQGLNVPVSIVSRTAGDNRMSYADLSAQTIQTHRLIINATPLGMPATADQCPDMPYASLTAEHILFDAIYNPPETKFLQMGREHHTRRINGSKMFVEQALAAWKIWNE
ncbi:MAG: VTT domain-containing protein [Paludibacter sp.]|jgi:shikimate dehydrogenase|nr:VTT domain-containing protein [Paludibacter sp.]